MYTRNTTFVKKKKKKNNEEEDPILQSTNTMQMAWTEEVLKRNEPTPMGLPESPQAENLMQKRDRPQWKIKLPPKQFDYVIN